MNLSEKYLIDTLHELITLGKEAEWIEFKVNNAQVE